jgi:Sulfotransferase family
MEWGINKPIFVIGSPRSGTSILSWCLGQHPNIIALEESGWMGDLATNLAVYYQIGTARGDYSLLSSMDVKDAEFFSAFGKTVNDLILRHRVDLNRNRWQHAAGPDAVMGPGTKSHLALDPKARWVDATPEYSFHICGLRRLFPEALFIHIFRDVSSVVRSMLHFHRVSGQSLVGNVQEAYSYWLRTVNHCLMAERAYGRHVVFRIRHSDLVNAPEGTLRSVFNFLSEPFASECLEPLAQRINSSNVPADFEVEDREADPRLVEQAMRLCREVEQTPQSLEGSVEAIAEIEAAFEERVQFVATLASNYNKALQKIATLKHKHPKNKPLADRLAKKVRGNKSIIQRFRVPKQRYKLNSIWWRALRERFRKGKGDR